MTKAAHTSFRLLWRNLAVVSLIVASFVAVYAWTNNDNRIDDIQKSRIESCRSSYEGVRQVFKPFFRSKSQRTAKEQRNIEKFNRKVDDLKSTCPEQVEP